MESTNIETLTDLKKFMGKIEPQLENLLKLFFKLKIDADTKGDINLTLNYLENQFKEINATVLRFKSSKKRINNFLKSIADFTKRDVLRIGNMSKTIKLDFFDSIMKDYKNGNQFNYDFWGQMNKRLQQYYLRIYTFYSKAVLYLVKNEI